MTVEEQPEGAIYSAGAVARMLRMTPAELHSLEEQYGEPVPAQGGVHLYSRADVERLRYLKDQSAAGAAVESTRREVRDPDGSPRQVPPRPGATSVVILLAERDRYAAELSEYFLRTEGYDVRVALDAEAARAAFSARLPDVAIVDTMISGGVGLDLCRELRERSDQVQVLAISVLGVRDQALDAGAHAFLVKPLEPLRLVSTVRDLLRTSALTRPDEGDR